MNRFTIYDIFKQVLSIGLKNPQLRRVVGPILILLPVLHWFLPLELLR